MAAASSDSPQDITVKCSSEYEDYTYSDSHDIWTLVSLTAPCQNEDEEQEEKVPMDIVAVMDKSGSMAGEKLELVKRTLEFVLTQLNDKDRLSLITYDTEVYADFGLMNMTQDNKRRASEKIQNITDGSSTNLCGGLLRGLCEILNRYPDGKNDVASVLLFTDGLANVGIQKVDGIVKAMADPKRYCGATAPPTHRDKPTEPAPHTSWLKNVFGGGSSAAKSSPSKSSNESPRNSIKNTDANSKPDPSNSVNDATVYTFGFGADHDANMLKKISDAGNGMYYFIETEDKIGESFAHCLGGLSSTVAQGIQLAVTVDEGVKIKEVHTTRVFEETEAGKSIKVNIGDLQAEESRDIVLELALEPLGGADQTPDIVYLEQNVLDVTVDYFNVNTSNLETAVGALKVKRQMTPTEHNETNANVRIKKEKDRVDMTKAIKVAGDRARRGSWDGTQDVLNERIGNLRVAKQTAKASDMYDSDLSDEYDAMIDDLEDYCSNTKSAADWQMKGQHQEMNMGQEYECQRSNLAEAKAFQTKSRSKAVKSFKLF